MTITDRSGAVSSDVAVKLPVAAATTANITLSGEQTIDGVAVVSGDRVLVKNQTDGTENGIYDVAIGAWTRSADCSDTFAFTQGTMVLVLDGDDNGDQIWQLTAADPEIGSTSLTWASLAIAGPQGPTGSAGSDGSDGEDSYLYVAYASDASGTDFTTTFNSALDYIAVLASDTEILTPEASDFAGLWKNYKGADGENGVDGEDSYLYIAYASDASGTDFTTTFNSALDYIAIKASATEIPSPAASDFTGLWKNYQGADGVDGADGEDSYLYVAYASDASGTDFTTTFNSALDYIAIKATTTAIPSPAASDFTGLWKNYKGADGVDGVDGAAGADGTNGVDGADGADGAAGSDGAGYGGTSSTSVAIATGDVTVTTQAGLAYQIGTRVRLTYAGGVSNYMDGVVTAYTDSSMTIAVDAIGGSGTYGSWNLSVTGQVGAAGSTGSAGADGADGADGAGYGGTSGTSYTIATGEATFVTQAGLAYQVGARVRVSYTTDPTNYAEGLVTDYTDTDITVDVDNIGGSGTQSNWNLNIAGDVGETGATGSTGAAGADGATGADGAQGDTGPPGFAFPYTFDDGTSSADPGSGQVSANDADLSAATELYINETGSDSVSIAGILDNLDSCTASIKGFVRLVSQDDPTSWAAYNVTDVTDNGSWRTFAVTWVAGPTTALTLDDPLYVQISRATDVSGATGKHTVGAASGAIYPALTNGCADLAQAESSVRKINYKYLAFDPTSIEYAWFAMPTPKAYNASTVTMRAVWTHPSTTTNFDVVWQFEILALSNDDAIDTALGTAVTVTDTGGTTEDFYRTAATSAITPGNTAAKEDWFMVRVSRKASDGSDTLAVDAYLLGVELFYTTDAADDT